MSFESAIQKAVEMVVQEEVNRQVEISKVALERAIRARVTEIAANVCSKMRVEAGFGNEILIHLQFDGKTKP